MVNWRSHGIFRREARWMFVLTVLIPLLALTATILVPWAARRLR